LQHRKPILDLLDAIRKLRGSLDHFDRPEGIQQCTGLIQSEQTLRKGILDLRRLIDRTALEPKRHLNRCRFHRRHQAFDQKAPGGRLPLLGPLDELFENLLAMLLESGAQLGLEALAARRAPGRFPDSPLTNFDITASPVLSGN
jgi:hypothetical protein